MAVKTRIMKTVSPGTKEIIGRRARKDNLEELFRQNAALALVQGSVCDMIFASDVAQKASDVEVFEIMGSCPQHMTCLGILGDVAAVEAAVQKVKAADSASEWIRAGEAERVKNRKRLKNQKKKPSLRGRKIIFFFSWLLAKV